MPSIDSVRFAMEAEERLRDSEESRDELDRLPAGHPLRVAIEESRRRLEERLAMEAEEAAEEERQEEGRKRRKAKRGQRQADRRAAEEKKRRRRQAARSLNGEIADLRAKMVSLVSSLPGYAEELEGVPGAAVRIERLKRLSQAFHRGVEGSKINVFRLGE